MTKLRAPTFALFILIMTVSTVFAQQTQVVSPNGLIAIAEEALPSKVYEAQKNVLEIRTRFFPIGNPSSTIIAANGSGFVEKNSGLVVSSRHIIIENMIDIWSHQGEPFYIDKNGLPQGMNYGYEIKAVVHTATGESEYPLELKAIGSMGTHTDVMVLKSSKPIPVRGLELSYSAKPGDKVYASGFTSYSTHYHDAKGRTNNFQLDHSIKYNFESVVLAILETNAVKSAGLKRVYRLARGADFGFSGGPVLNDSGQVNGITNQTDSYFSYAISSHDIAEVIKLVK